MKNDLDIGLGATGINGLYNRAVKLTHPTYYEDLKWYHRIPIPVDSFYNVVHIFPFPVWMATLFTLFFFSCLLLVVHRTYGREPFKSEGLRTDHLAQTGDFFLLGIFAVYENDAMPWFEKPSVGLFEFPNKSQWHKSVFFCINSFFQGVFW